MKQALYSLVFRRLTSNLVLILTLIVFLFGTLLIRKIQSPDLRLYPESVTSLSDDWNVQWKTSDGTEKTASSVSLPSGIRAPQNTVVVYRRTLPVQGGSRSEDNTITFFSNNQSVLVYLDDSLIYEYGSQVKYPVSIPLQSGWRFVSLPENWQGKTLSISLDSTLPSSSGYLGEVYLGNHSAILYKILCEVLPTVLLFLPALCVGLVLLMFSFMKQSGSFSLRVRYLGLFFVILTLWIFSETRGSQFLFHKPVTGVFAYLLVSLMAPVCDRYLLTYPFFANDTLLKRLLVVSCVSTVLIVLSQLLDLWNFHDTLFLSHLCIISTMVYVIFRRIQSFFHPSSPSFDAALGDALILLAIFGFFDILNFYLSLEDRSGLYITKYGFFLFMVVLLMDLVERFQEQQRSAIEAETLLRIAYTDSLTQLGNRAAFDRDIHELILEKPEENSILLLADMNNLKMINDTIGHSYGDIALKYVAEHLQRAFRPLRDSGSLYRIGGDEFVVLLHSSMTPLFSEALKTLEQPIAFEKHLPGTCLRLAYGYVEFTHRDFDNALKSVDQRMYEMKASMKHREN